MRYSQKVKYTLLIPDFFYAQMKESISTLNNNCPTYIRYERSASGDLISGINDNNWHMLDFEYVPVYFHVHIFSPDIISLYMFFTQSLWNAHFSFHVYIYSQRKLTIDINWYYTGLEFRFDFLDFLTKKTMALQNMSSQKHLLTKHLLLYLEFFKKLRTIA